MPSEGLIVETGEESFIGGGMSDWFCLKSFAAGCVIMFLFMLLLTVILPAGAGYNVPAGWAGLEEILDANGEGTGMWKKVESFYGGRDGFGNRTRATMMPTGANPNTGAQEGSQPGAGGYGRQWDPTTGQYTYIRPEFDKLDRNLASAIEGGRSDQFAGGPNFNSNTYNRWSKDDREKKGMRMYSDLRQKAIAQGNEWNQSFDEWYKGWKSLPDNRLASDAYYKDGMTVKPMKDNELMSRAHGGL